jgi:IgA Peptidase M64
LQIKWNAWISNNTPVPTPAIGTYQYAVGLFEGAHYHATNWYRPYYDCCMKSFGYVGFCPVCQQTLVVAIYGKTRPIQSHWPTTNNMTVTSPQLMSFSLNLLQPATHNLSVQWLTNGVVVSDATNPVLNLWPGQLGNGTNQVEADIVDGTEMVRTDAKNHLKQTNIWTLNISVPVMQINQARWLTNGSFSFEVTGSAPAGVVIQMSTNLFQWTPVLTGSLTSKLLYTNMESNLLPERYFRAETPP